MTFISRPANADPLLLPPTRCANDDPSRLAEGSDAIVLAATHESKGWALQIAALAVTRRRAAFTVARKRQEFILPTLRSNYVSQRFLAG